MIIRLYDRVGTTNVQRRIMRVIRVYDRNIPEGVSESSFTQKGGLLAGSGAAAFGELPPGSAGQYLTPDPTATLGLRYETPSVSISDTTNYLINGGFDIAQRQAPATLTTISDNGYGPDRWKSTRENADLQFQRNDATGESGLTSRYYGKYKKITNAGKFMALQIIEGVNSVPLRGRTVIFQAKMKASAAKTIRMAIIQLQTGGTIDTIPGTFVTAWNVDSTDPTLGANLAVVTGVQSKSVTTAWQNFSVSVSIPSDAKNVICAIWSDADFSVGDELNIAEAGLFLGSSLIAWSPRLFANELALCRRYCYKSFPVDTLPTTKAGVNGSKMFIAGKAGASTNYWGERLPVEMRGTPAVTQYNPSAANFEVRDTIAGADCSATSAVIGNTLLYISCTGNASTAVGNLLRVHFLAYAEL